MQDDYAKAFGSYVRLNDYIRMIKFGVYLGGDKKRELEEMERVRDNIQNELNRMFDDSVLMGALKLRDLEN